MNLLKNFSFQTALVNVLASGLSLLASLAIAVLLGPEGLGTVYTLVTATVIISLLLTLGLNAAAVHFLGSGRFDSRTVVSSLFFLPWAWGSSWPWGSSAFWPGSLISWSNCPVG